VTDEHAEILPTDHLQNVIQLDNENLRRNARMILQAGKTYRTRDGHKVNFIARPSSNHWYGHITLPKEWVRP